MFSGMCGRRRGLTRRQGLSAGRPLAVGCILLLAAVPGCRGGGPTRVASRTRAEPAAAQAEQPTAAEPAASPGAAQDGKVGQAAPAPPAAPVETTSLGADAAAAQRFAGKTVWHGPRSGRKTVCLTFDDGPTPDYTPQVLDILKREGVRATFFMEGIHADSYPDLAARVVQEGHAVGNHTYSHAKGSSDAEAAWQVDRGAEAIVRATGVRPLLFRAPGDDLKSRVASCARREGYPMIMATVLTGDPTGISAKSLIAKVMRRTGPGDIVIMHDSGCPHTPEALPTIIERLKARGYAFLTIPQMLEELGRRSSPGRPRSAQRASGRA